MTPQDTFLQYGVLGAVCVVLSGVVAYLFRELSKARADAQAERAAYLHQLEQLQDKRIAEVSGAQQKRVDDAQSTRTQVIEMTEEVTQAFGAGSSATRENAEALRTVKDAFRELADEVRELANDLRAFMRRT